MTSLVHLSRRFFTSLSRRAPSEADSAWALVHLLPAEAALWERMAVQDRRHSILVARRFAERLGSATRDELAAALLHDVGKVSCNMGTFARVVATLVGPRTERFRRYHAHERIGVELLQHAGSSAATLDLVRGVGPAAAALQDADDV
ncbi:MAG: HD domain-containing protein [Actinomycetota bacterium]